MGVGADARPEGGLPDCGEGTTNGERVVLALPRFATPSLSPLQFETLTRRWTGVVINSIVLSPRYSCRLSEGQRVKPYIL